MLSPANERILQWIFSNDKIFISDEEHPEWITEVRLDALTKSGALECLRESSPAIYRITPVGEDALAALSEERQKRASEEAKHKAEQAAQDQRHKKERLRSWVQFAITTIVTILAIFSATIVEKLTGLVERIWALLK